MIRSIPAGVRPRAALSLVAAATLLVLTGSAISAVTTPNPGPFTGCLATTSHRSPKLAAGEIYNVAASATDPSAACVSGDIVIALGQGAPGPSGAPGADGAQAVAVDATVQSGDDGVTNTAAILDVGDISLDLGCRMSGGTQFISGELDVANGGDVAASNLYSLGFGGGGSTGAFQYHSAGAITGAQPWYVGVGAGSVSSVTGTVLIRDANNVVTLNFHAEDDPDAATCRVWGSYVVASRT